MNDAAAWIDPELVAAGQLHGSDAQGIEVNDADVVEHREGRGVADGGQSSNSKRYSSAVSRREK